MVGTSMHDGGAPTSGTELVLRLWPRPPSCQQARWAVRAFCFAHGLPHLADDAELLTSELVTNAIKHTGTLVTLVAICDDGELIVNIRDDAAGAGPVPAPADADAESGRGMQLVVGIAGRWGSTPHNDGKSVWFRLP